MIVLIVAVSAGIAYFVANSLFGGKTENGVTVKTIDPITSVIQPPDAKIFNKDAINPSVGVNVNATNSSSTTP
ncbi:MAG: hypothetical protein JWN12_551 [Candidatus Saccharibacteria bacterium]|nr:hypothetical protein [Candidatus Saccharibacteria bacterium]